MRISDWSSDVCSSDLISNFDVLLAERVLGATGAGRRSTTIEWDNIDRLTSWRFGMATATAIPIPAGLRASQPGYMQGWTVLAPMGEMADRIAAAPAAAMRGVLSSAAYVSLLSAAASDAEPSAALATETDTLRSAFGAGAAADRYAAMQTRWGEAAGLEQRSAALIATETADRKRTRLKSSN